MVFRVTSWIVGFPEQRQRSTKSHETTRTRKYFLCELTMTFEAKPSGTLNQKTKDQLVSQSPVLFLKQLRQTFALEYIKATQYFRQRQFVFQIYLIVEIRS